jgi:hypothetical protein
MEYLKDAHVCGRTLGIRLDTRNLYIADAYHDLSKGGLATPLATEDEGVRFNFTNNLDLDGDIDFTCGSILYQRRYVMRMPNELLLPPYFSSFISSGWLCLHIFLLYPLPHGPYLLVNSSVPANWKVSLC